MFGGKELVGSDLRQQKERVAVVSFVLTWAQALFPVRGCRSSCGIGGPKRVSVLCYVHDNDREGE